MHKLVFVLRHDMKAAIAPVAFFFVMFHLGALTKSLVLESYAITLGATTVATLSALTVAKAILIADDSALANRFSTRALPIAVAWKAVIFAACVLAFRLLEELVPHVLETGSLGAGISALWSGISWPLFLAIQIWMTTLILLYTGYSEIARRLPPGTFRAMALKPT